MSQRHQLHPERVQHGSSMGKRHAPSVTERQIGEKSEAKLPKKALRMATKGRQRTCLELKVRIKGKWLSALVDSGADMNFISPTTVNELRLPWRDKNDPYTVHDGQGETYLYEDGKITREIDHLKVFVNGKNQGIDFDIIPVWKYDLVLGYPWLLRYNL